MGTLLLGRIASIHLDDDMLAHVHAVIIAKLRVREPVSVAWVSEGGLRDEIIVNPATTVVASFESPQARPLDRVWLNRLMIAANSVRGLSLTPQLVQSFRLDRDAAASAARDATAAAPGDHERSGAAGPDRSPSLHSVPSAPAVPSGQRRRRQPALEGD